MKVPIIMGSESDREWSQKIVDRLERWGVESEIKVASAHKVPEKVFELMERYNGSGDEMVLITVAGRSNGLSGVCAANSVYPVIACPPHKTKEDYMVDINSTLRMPSNTPVLTVCDPSNAADAVVRILAVGNDELRGKVVGDIEDVKGGFSV